MSDISTVWNPAAGRGEWLMLGADLQSGNDLQTALVISLFTDRQADIDDVITDATQDPRGWWGDLDQDYKIGSKLWLLARSKQSKETLQRANKYIAEALQWLLDDGVAARFDITCEWTTASRLGVRLVAYRSDGSSTQLSFESVRKGIS